MYTRTDPWLKKESILGFCTRRGWRAVCLSDVRFGPHGIFEWSSQLRHYTFMKENRRERKTRMEIKVEMIQS